MSERGFQFRELWLVPLIFVAIVPVAIFGLVAMLFDRSPPFEHGPYNGHQHPEDI